MDKQFDVSPEAKRVFEEKQAQRLALRNQYLKNITNPHRHATGEGGAIFDSGMFRFMAMRAKEYHYFKPTPSNFLSASAVVFLPILVYGYLIKSERDERERAIRNGEVSYRDRRFKLV